MFYENLYDFEKFDYEELLRKKHSITWRAYQISFNSSDDRCTKRVHVIVPLDCDGAPVPTAISGNGSSFFAYLCPGAEWAYPRYTCWNAYDWASVPYMIIDKRSWLDILRGCCIMFGEED